MSSSHEIVSEPTQAKTVRDQLVLCIPRMQEVLPSHMTGEQMVQIACSAVSRNPSLLECTALSLAGAVVKASELGFSVDPILGNAYLVPFWNRKRTPNVREAQLILGYKGMMDISWRSGLISYFQGREVYEDDGWDFQYGANPKLVHVPTKDYKKRGKVVAFYAVAHLNDGNAPFHWLWREEAEYIKDHVSKSGSDGPWVSNFNAMGIKSAMRRLWTWLPRSSSKLMQDVEKLEAAVDAGESQHLEEELPASMRTKAAGFEGALDIMTAEVTGEVPETETPSDPTPPAPEMKTHLDVRAAIEKVTGEHMTLVPAEVFDEICGSHGVDWAKKTPTEVGPWTNVLLDIKRHIASRLSESETKESGPAEGGQNEIPGQ